VTARLALFIIVGILFGVAGCGKAPDAEFTYNDRTQGLIRQARKPVEEAITEGFGTPHDLVAWQKLPVEFGRLEGEIEKLPEAKKIRSFDVHFDTKPSVAIDGLALLWLSGQYAGEQLGVREFDSETSELTLAGGFEVPPKVGDKFAVIGHSLKEGRRLYMTHCLHCHGVSGDGNGPTAPYLNPRPRDYRLGLFKFTSTKQPDRARRDDLSRIIKLGIPGTYMPSFMLLKDDELETIVEYVRWLAIRGEFENKLNAELEGDYSKKAFKQRVEQGETEEEILSALEAFQTDDLPGIIDDSATDLSDVWNQAETDEHLITPSKKRPAADAASLARGRALYLSAKAKCAACHGITGKGDGPQTEDIQQGFTVPGLFDQWKNPIKPRDLTRGVFRGGRRPIDLYRRLFAGIKGTPMPAFGGTVLNDDEIWDLVNYVLSIPHNKNQSASTEKRGEVASTPAPSKSE